MNHSTPIDTPALVVDERIALNNIQAFQQHCNQAGLKLRPHIKTHKSTHFTRLQLLAGACGITCQKISEAEAMADGGARDILITFNILGQTKLDRLKALSRRLDKLTVVADNLIVVDGLSRAFEHELPALNVMVECDTGAKRCGVQTPSEALTLAQSIHQRPGLTFAGLMTYPAPGGANQAAEFMRKTIELLDAIDIACPEVSTGGTPDMWTASTQSVFTEYRIGTYIYNDRSLVDRGVASEDTCAARVHATVVSRPTAERLVIDAGSKALTSDLMGYLTDYGRVVGHPDAVIQSLSEEHGVIEVPADNKLIPGDIIEIIPNHVCVVCNMFDKVWLRNNTGKLQSLSIDARGLML